MLSGVSSTPWGMLRGSGAYDSVRGLDRRLWPEAVALARAALRETRGILDPVNGKVTR